FSSRRRHTRFSRDWSSDVCSSDLELKNSSANPKKSDAEKSKTKPSESTTKGEIKAKLKRDAHFDPTFEDIEITEEDIRKTEELRSEERRVGKGRRSRG